MSRNRDELLQLYDQHYRSDSAYGGIHPSHKLILNQSAALRDRGVKSIFEIGCGRGQVLRCLSQHGFLASGCEPSQSCQQDLGDLGVFSYAVHELDEVADGSEDFVYSVNVVDHLASLYEAAQAIRHSHRIARLGFAIIVNGDLALRTIAKTAEQWGKALKRASGIDPSLISRKHAGSLLVCWKALEGEDSC